MLATGDAELLQAIRDYKEKLKSKVIKANDDLAKVKFNFKVN
jgi:5-(carboxyamino)imidazole ribonucleotide mutase